MKRMMSFVLMVMLAIELPLLAVGGKKAAYIGGTLSSVPEKTEGLLSTRDEAAVSFRSDKGKGSFTIPYASITGLEYGQNAGRRVAVALLVSPIAIFSKKRKHYLTINYRDQQGKEQAAVLELGKDVVRTTLTIMETRSGKKIEYQDEEAAKAGRGK